MQYLATPVTSWGGFLFAVTRRKRAKQEHRNQARGKRGIMMANLKYMQHVYEQLHKYPEISLEECWTAGFVAEELRKMGFSVQTKVGGEGVVGLLELAGPGQTIAFRSDMDALPVLEETGASYASQNEGVMHACGHDSHMAMLLGVCRYASQQKQNLKGTLMAIFQPAEEIGAGARAMLEGGLFAATKPHRLVGIHNWPSLPAGQLGLQEGPISAYADTFKAAFLGQGGHGALPHKTKDPIAMAAMAVHNAFALVQRSFNAAYPQTLSFGVIKGGTRANVIPSKVSVEGTVRTVRTEDQDKMIGLLHQAFETSSALYGGEYVLEYRKGVDAVVNSAAVVGELRSIFERRIPAIPVVTQGLASLIGEDLAYYLYEVPGVLLYVGSGQQGLVNELHHPSFLVPRQTLETGYRALTSIVDEYLG
jgi:amidohydrolase